LGRDAENTLWEIVSAAWAVEKVYKEREVAGQRRTLEVVEMPVPIISCVLFLSLTTKLGLLYGP
jgi:hypothetical protein